MKKSIIFLAFAALLCGGVQAQDTLRKFSAPLDNYFYNNWIDTTKWILHSYASSTDVLARRFITEDTLRVYGIAAMMTCPDSFSFYLNTVYPDLQSYLNDRYPEDPSFLNCRESLMLYQYHGPDSTAEMRQVGELLPIHFLDTAVSYWLMSPDFIREDSMPKPVYERYYDEPQIVFDTFYAGFTQTQCELKGAGRYIQVRPGFDCFRFSFFDPTEGIGGTNYPVCHARLLPRRHFDPVTGALVYEDDLEWEFHCYRPEGFGDLFIFPILTPKPSGGDSNVAVQGSDMMDRYVAVQPNPAHGRATVVSSFGMTAIEVYDTQGRLLQTLPAEGLKADLDVSSWPRATYLLRIRTPMGTVTRKLLVQ